MFTAQITRVKGDSQRLRTRPPRSITPPAVSCLWFLQRCTGVYDDSLTHTPHNVQHSQHSQHTSKKIRKTPTCLGSSNCSVFFFSVKVATRSGQRKLRQLFLPKKSAHFSFSLGSFFLYHKKWHKTAVLYYSTTRRSSITVIRISIAVVVVVLVVVVVVVLVLVVVVG